MTRINVVPTHCLSDKHLLAEYRELPRVFTAVKKLTEEGRWKTYDIPYKYKLGTGHVKFFYNKLEWLLARYFLLMRELRRRNVKLNLELYGTISNNAARLIQSLPSSQQIQGWKPTPEDMYLNMARLVKRSNFEEAKEEMQSGD